VDAMVMTTVAPVLEGEGEASSCWDQLVSGLQENADFSHPAAGEANHSNLFTSTYTVWKALKGTHPEYFADVVMMLYPMKDGSRLGQCSLLPSGLSNPALDTITSEMMDKLLVSMETSESVRAAKDSPTALSSKEKKKLADQKAKAEAASAKLSAKVSSAIAKSDKSKAKSSSSSSKMLSLKAKEAEDAIIAVDSKLGLASMAEVISETRQDFLDHLTGFLRYLLKIDPRQRNKAMAIKYLALKACMVDEVQATSQQTSKPRF
jgi:hypothetical protein